MAMPRLSGSPTVAPCAGRRGVGAVNYGSGSACARMARAPGGRSLRRMPTRIAINGFGRIGRGMVRAAAESGSELEIVAVNDVADAATLAHLLAYDTIYGRFPGAVRTENGILYAGDLEIRALAERDPSNLPWAELGVDVVIESTGKFRTRAGATRHLDAGAR